MDVSESNRRRRTAVAGRGRGRGYRIAVGAGVAAIAAGGVYAVIGLANGSPGSSGGPGDSATVEDRVVAPESPAEESVAAAIEADPKGDAEAEELVLTAPAKADPGSSVTFAARWLTTDGRPVTGEVDLQRIKGDKWSTVSTVPVQDGVGHVDVEINASAIYRLAYGGSDTVEATASEELVVRAGEPLASRITATAEESGDDGIRVTAAWTTEGGVPIVGDLGLEKAGEDEWEPVTTAVTGAEGTGVATVGAEETARFRFSYSGGNRFGSVVSDEAVVLGDDIRTIPVEVCIDNDDLDALPAGVGCHYTPVSSGTFVAGHDYLDNAWWNSVPMGSYVKLTGELAGLYKVVDRVIAPGRGAALGSASNWTCGDDCDVILQTCQGRNTGFTWLRKVTDEQSPAG